MDAEVRVAEEVVLVGSLGELAEVVQVLGSAFIRFSGGPEADAAGTSTDKESGATLPGLSVNPLVPEPWWDRPLEHWLARQLCQYMHLGERERRGWVVTGTVVGHGPDCEPLVSGTRWVAVLDDRVLAEAQELYHRVFDAGRV